MKPTPLSAATCLALLGVAVLTAGQPGGQMFSGPRLALDAMADAERAFARTAIEKGVRDAFVEFFANDSIGFYPAPTNGREFYRKQPPSPLTRRLEWEPRLGDIASSGELGWLTGPFTSRDTTSGAPPRHGCYFSLWGKRRPGQTAGSPCTDSTPDCTWKVLMDVGIGTPGPVAFENAGFAPVAEPRGRFAQARAGAPATENSILAAERDFAAAARRDPAAAYRAVVTAVSRLHVPGQQPMTGDAIAAFAAESKQADNTVQASSVARSGDLGFVYGGYGTRSPEAQERATAEGYYVRTWKRGADGKWTLAVEVRSPLPPSR